MMYEPNIKTCVTRDATHVFVSLANAHDARAPWVLNRAEIQTRTQTPRVFARASPPRQRATRVE